MSESGHATLVVDPHKPYSAYSVVITDEWGNVVHRTLWHEEIGPALMNAAQWLGKPLTIELKQLAPI